MTKDSYSSNNLRSQPKQQRGRERVEKILDAAAAVFDEIGYETATTHMIAAKAKTAIGSIYQFFPDKAAIFKAMELRHIERVKSMYVQMNLPEILQLPLREMINTLVNNVAQLFEQPVSRVVFIQFFMSGQIFQSIDDTMTQEAINFMASILKGRNSRLNEEKYSLLAEVCVHSSNSLILAALRSQDPQHRQLLIQQIKDLMVSYLEPYIGDVLCKNVMKVMKCPECQFDQLYKNGYRRGKQCYCCKNCGRQFVASSPQ
jgi:AcrR family transcriptional regulator